MVEVYNLLLQKLLGKQKRQLLDEQDLHNQNNLEQLQKKQSNVIQQSDLFDAAKLQENYFIRSDKKNQKQGAVINFDQDQQQDIVIKNNTKRDKYSQKYIQQQKVQKNNQNQVKINQNQNQDQLSNTITKNSSKQIANNTEKKRKRKPIKNKKQSIFDEDQSEEQAQVQNQQIQKIQQKQQNNSSISNSSQNSNQQKKQEKDDFDKMIKAQQKQDQQSQEQQTLVHLHKLLASLKNKQQRKQYYYQPLKINQVALGFFKRQSSGLSQIYQFLGQDHRPLLYCQNQRGCIGCNYYISMTKQMDKNNPSYLGKLRGNAAGSTYFLYDCGGQPKNQIDRSNWRVSLAAIQYQSNFMGFNGPRKLKVTIPEPKHFQDPDTFKLSEQQSILKFKPPIVAQFRNKTPKWNQKLKSYALNFGGRVKLASIKNFILISDQFKVQEQDLADNVIVFGKVDENTFSIQYRYPLSIFQAFGIIMSQFDFKLNCQ